MHCIVRWVQSFAVNRMEIMVICYAFIWWFYLKLAHNLSIVARMALNVHSIFNTNLAKESLYKWWWWWEVIIRWNVSKQISNTIFTQSTVNGNISPVSQWNSISMKSILWISMHVSMFTAVNSQSIQTNTYWISLDWQHNVKNGNFPVLGIYRGILIFIFISRI